MRKKAGGRIAAVGILAATVLLTGCVSHSEIVYENGTVKVSSLVHSGNPALIQGLKEEPDEWLEESESARVLDCEEAFELGALTELKISQKLMTQKELKYDGRRVQVVKDTPVINWQKETLAILTAGESVVMDYLVGDQAVVFVGDDYGFADAANLADEAGNPLVIQTLPGVPEISAENGIGTLVLGSQQAFTLTGEYVETIRIEESVSADAYINMDFGTLIVEGTTRVHLYDCSGAVVRVKKGAQVTTDQAVITQMTALD